MWFIKHQSIIIHNSYQCYMLFIISLPFFLRGNNMDSFLGCISDFYGTAAFPHRAAIRAARRKINNWLVCNFYKAHIISHMWNINPSKSTRTFPLASVGSVFNQCLTSHTYFNKNRNLYYNSMHKQPNNSCSFFKVSAT